jgi:hypothetical protein
MAGRDARAPLRSGQGGGDPRRIDVRRDDLEEVRRTALREPP